MYGYAALLALALIAVGTFAGYQKGAENARNACIAASAAKQDKVTVETERRDTASTEAHSSILDYLATIPKTETKTHEAANRVRKIYIDRPVLAACDVRPPGVLEELQQARNRAIQTIGAVRPPAS
jgi:hypothetical protein